MYARYMRDIGRLTLVGAQVLVSVKRNEDRGRVPWVGVGLGLGLGLGLGVGLGLRLGLARVRG